MLGRYLTKNDSVASIYGSNKTFLPYENNTRRTLNTSRMDKINKSYIIKDNLKGKNKTQNTRNRFMKSPMGKIHTIKANPKPIRKDEIFGGKKKSMNLEKYREQNHLSNLYKKVMKNMECFNSKSSKSFKKLKGFLNSKIYCKPNSKQKREFNRKYI